MAKIFICGDIINYEHDDGLICSDPLAEIISSCDYSICNFEAPIEGYGKPIPKSGIHHFQRKGTISGLKKQGFDLLCLANNHIMDYGKDALLATIEEASKHNLETIGAGSNFDEAYQPLIKNIDGLSIGFINVCEAQFGVLDYATEPQDPGYAWINHYHVDYLITKLRERCDFVVILAHAGLENYSIPLKEWRIRYRQFCDLGADVVVASHPHVPQGYEKYKDSYIFYSLGNFYFDSKNYRGKEDRTYSVVLELEKDKNVDVQLIYHHKENGKVQLSPPEKQIDIDQLSNQLLDTYEKQLTKVTLKVYEQTIRKNLIYSLVPFPYNGDFLSSVKLLINTILGRRRNIDKNLLSLHLIRNETYYYIARYALELKAKGISR